jgi:DNA invertase Pin-like site-specific DNA recombinase
MLTMLGGLAKFERQLIRIRTGEGGARAKENGISLGRKPGAKFLRTRVREHSFPGTDRHRSGLASPDSS